ncbi:NADH dehydrogenase [ubiquinone] 1 alpha subcomplex assembly factor 2 [Athalia rosae]|uniref:NADH dehydrogenase [ubiquinone] 1 alpha subcomplex assembly factor 2 n=1 Tax=Athalia rosae TaxID=37344 RepID=UPI0020339FAB|nr:NADH dehydrogenase [ubiquinone] 1 alpha subcomplex assembly factor 2 [Athalia rosae]
MGGKVQRGVFQTIFKHLINSFKPRRFTGDLVGSDYLGNKYYQHSQHATSEKKLPARYFVPKIEDNFEQEIPAEWEAWLRHRRKEPPAESEVLRNFAIMKMKKNNAIELDNALRASRAQKQEVAEIHRVTKFPKYPEYENVDSEHPKNPKD